MLKTAICFFSQQLRKYDVIFRYGGDEFLFLFPDTESDHASQLLERLRQELKNTPIKVNDNKKIYVSVSIGMSEMNDLSSPDEAIKLADNALIEAKSKGRDCICVWSANT